jgi:hypothetical protein
MASLALFALPGIIDDMGIGGGGVFGGATPPQGQGGNPPGIPDYQKTLELVQKQKEADQKAIEELGGQFKKINQGLSDKLGATQKEAISALSKQKEIFDKSVVNVEEVVEKPGIPPDVLFYGGLLFGGLALLIVIQKNDGK